MKKRILSVLLILILVVSVLPINASAAGSLSNFTKSKTYATGQFSDVSDQWFAPYVKASYEFNLVDGKTPTTYAPGNNLTIAEAIKLAACLHSIYNTGSQSFASGTPWYQPYVDYALTNGIIKSPYPDYTVTATRADFAVIFANAMPDEALTIINEIDDNAIPDVPVGYTYGPAVYKLYRAGIMTGSDAAGTFYPNSNITRDAVAAVAARMSNGSPRLPMTLTAKELSGTEISAKCSPAVFKIQLLSKTGSEIGTGSGFFINSNGLAVTNYHVIQNMISAKITTADGKTYDVAGVYDYSEANDLALIQISGSGFPYLEIGDSSSAVTGANIYAIGYPLGIGPNVTAGTITNASHTVDGINYIMIGASISSGNSGGALINAFGKVIGVTSAFYSAGQNLNLAVPINLTTSLSATKPLVPLSTLFAKTITYYANYPTIPDFGTVTGSQLYNQDYVFQYQAQYYVYSTNNLAKDIVDVRNDYLAQLYVEGFEYLDFTVIDGYFFYIYEDTSKTLAVTVGILDLYNVEYIQVIISPAS